MTAQKKLAINIHVNARNINMSVISRQLVDLLGK